MKCLFYGYIFQDSRLNKTKPWQSENGKILLDSLAQLLKCSTNFNRELNAINYVLLHLKQKDIISNIRLKQK